MMVATSVSDQLMTPAITNARIVAVASPRENYLLQVLVLGGVFGTGAWMGCANAVFAQPAPCWLACASG
jgi:hypothetical protein